MKLIQAITQEEMIAAFLKGEITSLRFGERILEQLELLGADRAIVESPDTNSPIENDLRRKILAGYRSYVFHELPAGIRWYRALLTREEVTRIRYIDYDYWNELSGGTRLASAAAETIRAGREIFEVSNQGFLNATQALRDGAVFPTMILVSEAPGSAMTVIEGHLRLTAYLLAPECIPAELEVIIGFSPWTARI